MNRIVIWQPRWHDRVVLVADSKLQEHNEIVIEHHEYPTPLYLSGKRARQYPLEQMKTKAGGILNVRAIPLADITKEVI